MDTAADTLDSIIDGFDPANTPQPQRVHDGAPVTIWLPAEYKAKYDLVQDRSRKKFSRVLREVFMRAIDKVYVENEAS